MRIAMQSTKNRKLIFISLGLLVSMCCLISVVCSAFTYNLFTNPGRYITELPKNAKDVNYVDEDLFPDYIYRLRAKIDEKDFVPYVEKFKMTKHTPDRLYDEDCPYCISFFKGVKDYDWWNPTDSIENVYVYQSNTTWTYAKYENGYLYLVSWKH